MHRWCSFYRKRNRRKLPSTTTMSFDAPTRQPHEYPHIPYIFRNNRLTGLHFCCW